MTKGATQKYAVPGAGPITEPYQCLGREDQLWSISQSLQRRCSVWVEGGPKVGKTSLLYRIQERLEEGWQAQGSEWNQDLLGVYINVRQHAIQSYQSLFLSAFREIADRVSSFEFDAEAEFDRMYVRYRLEALHPTPVLLLDDFDCAIDSFTFDDFNGLRALDSSHVLYVLSTLPRRVSAEHPGSDFFLSILKVVLGPWTPDELDHFLREVLRRSSVDLTSYKKHILGLTGGFPFLVQLVCRLYLQAQAQSEGAPLDDPALIDDEFQARPEVQDYFTMVWRGFDDAKRELVTQLARGEWTEDTAVHIAVELERYGYLVDGRLFSTVFGEFVLGKRERGQGSS